MKNRPLHWLIDGLTDAPYRPWEDFARSLILFLAPWAITLGLCSLAGAVLFEAITYAQMAGLVGLGVTVVKIRIDVDRWPSRLLERIAAAAMALVFGKWALNWAFALSQPTY